MSVALPNLCSLKKDEWKENNNEYLIAGPSFFIDIVLISHFKTLSMNFLAFSPDNSQENAYMFVLYRTTQYVRLPLYHQ
jgi:hypothetical protein